MEVALFFIRPIIMMLISHLFLFAQTQLGGYIFFHYYISGNTIRLARESQNPDSPLSVVFCTLCDIQLTKKREKDESGGSYCFSAPINTAAALLEKFCCLLFVPTNALKIALLVQTELNIKKILRSLGSYQLMRFACPPQWGDAKIQPGKPALSSF